MNAKRLEVLVDEPLARRICEIANANGVTNYRLSTTVGGRGAHGVWQDDGLSGATGKLLFVTILLPDRANALVTAITPLLDDYDLILTVGDVEVVRGSAF